MLTDKDMEKLEADAQTEMREVFKVLMAVKHDLHPPTNPAVLLHAARYIYVHQNTMLWGGNPQHAIAHILSWTLQVMIYNGSYPQDWGDAVFVLAAMRSQLDDH